MSKKTAGRPPIDPEAGSRIHVAFRATPRMRSLLEAAAKESGRSMSQEAELRLERSFDREGLLSEVLTLAYGRETAGLLIAMGLLVERVGTTAAHERAVRSKTPVRQWVVDPYAFDSAIRAALDFLARLTQAKPLQDAAIRSEVTEARPILYAGELAREIRREASSRWSEETFGKDTIEQIRALIGAIADRFDTSGIAMQAYGASLGAEHGEGAKKDPAKR